MDTLRSLGSLPVPSERDGADKPRARAKGRKSEAFSGTAERDVSARLALAQIAQLVVVERARLVLQHHGNAVADGIGQASGAADQLLARLIVDRARSWCAGTRATRSRRGSMRLGGLAWPAESSAIGSALARSLQRGA